MNFELNEEQQQIKNSIREFAEAELLPHVFRALSDMHARPRGLSTPTNSGFRSASSIAFYPSEQDG